MSELNQIENKNIQEIYGKDYINWKNWTQGDFGRLKRSQRSYYKTELKKTRRVFMRGSKVLEIGFGAGSFLEYGRQQEWEISGVELNKSLVIMGKEKGFDVYDSGALRQFRTSEYDLIVAFDVLEHIPSYKINNFLFEIKRLLKNKGCFIARFPNGDSPIGLVNQNGDVTHVNYIGSGKIKYFADILKMNLLYCGAESKPIFGVDYRHTIHRLVTYPIKLLINQIINLIFFPRGGIEFCSLNLVLVYEAIKKES